jgi:hypothetical protein
VQAVDGPARHALVFQMVGRDDLPNAIALNSGIGTAARILGPAIGGLVLSTFCFNFSVLLPLVAERTLDAAPGRSG